MFPTTISSMLSTYREQVETELTTNILPFYQRHTVDKENGGFYGRLTNTLTVTPTAPKGLVQHSRLLWSFAQAYRLYHQETYLKTATHAYDFLQSHFLDKQAGGFFWLVDAPGQPLNIDKYIYGQAFAIYGFSEYFRATRQPQSLDTAVTLYHLLEAHAWDKTAGGYPDLYHRDWTLNLSQNVDEISEAVVAKSMNTHLHVLEAYTNLLRVWDNDQLRHSLHRLIRLLQDRIINQQTGHMRLHFDMAWQTLTPYISYGHDIEASWLLMEAADLLGHEALLAEVQATAVHMAQITYNEGRAADGSLFDEDPTCHKVWWVQAEAMVGFLNAYQLTDQVHFLEASLASWHYVQQALIDSQYGEWVYGFDRTDQPLNQPKFSIWKTPYHNSRACTEVCHRISALQSQK